jgi:hypothetical protein
MIHYPSGEFWMKAKTISSLKLLLLEKVGSGPKTYLVPGLPNLFDTIYQSRKIIPNVYKIIKCPLNFYWS